MWLCLWCRPLHQRSGGTAELRRHLATVHHHRALPAIELLDAQHRRLNAAGVPIPGDPSTDVDGWVIERAASAVTTPKAPAETVSGNWRDQAACLTSGLRPDTWHPKPGLRSEVTAAKRVCGICPVTTACLKFAMDNHMHEGVWGGTTPLERRRIRKAEKAPAT